MNIEAHYLGELLAVIHRDGGHYQDEHGTPKAYRDALAIIHDLRATNDAMNEKQEIETEIGQLEESLAYADTYQHNCSECGTNVWLFVRVETPIQCCPSCRRRYENRKHDQGLK